MAETALGLGLLIIAGTPVIGMLWAPAMAMLSDGAERVGLEQGSAFGLMVLTWATGQSIGDIGGARIGEAAGDEVAYLVLSALCIVCFLILRTCRSGGRRPCEQRPSGKARPMADSPARQERKLAGSGGRFVAIGAPLLVVGIVLALCSITTRSGSASRSPCSGRFPLVLGIVLMLSAGVQRRDRQGKPWA